jgi:hypothetical protein
MSRSDIEKLEDRRPFYLYVDEFQNFATDSFATILSEARKYGLNLTVANQYISQMSIEVKDAVVGNVGSIVDFRMGADDARGMQRYFEPKFLEYDLVHMHNRHFVISMTIEGEKVPAFSAISLNLPAQQADNTAEIINRSRAQYAVSREFVERYVGERYGSKQLSTSAKPVYQAKPTHHPTPVAFSNPQPKQLSEPTPEQKKPLAKPTTTDDATPDAPKKKRKRTRRRKAKTADTPPENNVHEIPNGGSGTISLK